MAPAVYLSLAVLAYGAMELLRSRGRENLGWAILILVGFPSTAAALMYHAFQFPPDADPRGVNLYVAEKTGGLVIAAALSLLGMLSPTGKVALSLIFLLVIANYTYATGNDPLDLDMPNALPQLGASLAMIGAFVLSRSRSIQRYFGQ